METDLSLFEAARRMDQTALAAIFDRYAIDLYNYVFRMCNDPFKADNIVGEVFTKFLEHLSAGKESQANLRSHLYKMAYHIVADGSRLSQREVAMEFTSLEPDTSIGHPSTPSSPENNMLLDKVHLAIKNRMSNDQRHVIILRYLEGFSLPETAEIVGKEVGNVKAIHNRAFVKLRQALEHRADA
jgi:RNA polymerase sigma-70 factor (ECF subfamily)